jgi:hypothetical protein
MFQIKVFWLVTLCSVVVGYQYLKRSMLPPSAERSEEDEASMDL